MVYPNYMVHIFYKIPKRGRKVLRTQVEMLTYLSALGIGIYQLEMHFAGVGEALLLAWVLPGFLTHCSLSWTLDFLPHWPHKDRARYGQTRVLEGKGSRDSFARPKFACCSSPLSSCTLLLLQTRL